MVHATLTALVHSSIAKRATASEASQRFRRCQWRILPLRAMSIVENEQSAPATNPTEEPWGGVVFTKTASIDVLVLVVGDSFTRQV